jgi:hypothetical protein
MMGRKERTFGPLPPLPLEELVPPDHFYVRTHAAAGLRSAGGGLPRLCAQATVHPLAARATRRAQSQRGGSGPGARLPRDGALRQGDAQTPSVGRAAVRGGERLARATPLPAPGTTEGQRRGAADRGGAEPEAPAQPTGVGPPTVPERSHWDRAPTSSRDARHPPVTTSLLRNPTATHAAAASTPTFSTG